MCISEHLYIKTSDLCYKKIIFRITKNIFRKKIDLFLLPAGVRDQRVKEHAFLN